MAPIATDAAPAGTPAPASDIAELKAKLQAANLGDGLVLPPDNTLRRYQKAGIDLSQGYPYFPPKPEFVQDVSKVREDVRDGKPYVDPATRADPEKKALFGAAKEVKNLTTHIGTEIVGLQLASLTDTQKDELALLVAERHIVFFRDQEISPQAQKELGLYLGDGAIETHVQAPQVPGVGGGLTLIWEDGRRDAIGKGRSWRVPYGGGQFGWHTDLVHEAYPPGYTHLHQDTVPEVGGDTLWASGFAAYDKLSPAFKKVIDGLNGIYRSAHKYKSAENPEADAQPVLRTHPLVRTHPVTGWKSLWVNRAMTVGIEGFDQPEADLLLNYLHDIYERSTDIQLRWHWTPGTSAIWDNRSTIHTVSYDYDGERHGTRVSSLAEKPYFDPQSKSKGEALNQSKWLQSPYINRY
jgi:alpha-ketoglutarate-dependent taurine dioxygenase